MKALDILSKLINAGCVNNGGIMTYDGSITIRDWFGAVRHNGEVGYGTYFYLYAKDYEDVLPGMPVPDVYIETEEAGNVWLWLIS